MQRLPEGADDAVFELISIPINITALIEGVHMLDRFRNMDKNDVKEKICMLVGIILFMLMTRYFRWTLNAPFQIYIDTFFFKASCFFCLIVLLLRHINLRNWRLYAGTVGYIGYAVFYLITHNDDYGVVYREFLIWRFVLRCLILIIVLDAFYKHENTHLKKDNLLYSVLFIVMSVFCLAIRFDTLLHFFFPAFVLFITPITESVWKKFLFCFSCGYYMTFFAFMIQSLIESPHMLQGRYYFGNFGSPYGAGVLTMGGLISALYLYEIIKETKNIMLKVFSVLTIIFPCAMAFLIGSRSIQLAAIMVMFLYFFMEEKETAKAALLQKRRMLIGLGAVIIVGLIVIVVVLNLNVDMVNEKLSTIGNEVVRNKAMYYVERINGLFNTSTYGVVFEEGAKINILDHFFAERISIWYMNMQRMAVWGNSVIEAVDGYGPHSIYVYWLVKFGWIGGILFIVTVIVGVITAGARLNTNRRVYLIPFLWMVYYLAAGIGEQPFFEFDISVLFVVFQYPILFSLKDEADEKELITEQPISDSESMLQE